MKKFDSLQLKFCIPGLIIQITFATILIIAYRHWTDRLLVHAAINAISAIPLWIYLSVNHNDTPVNNKPNRISELFKCSVPIITGLIAIIILSKSLIIKLTYNATSKTGLQHLSGTCLLFFTILAFSGLFISIFFVKLTDHSDFIFMRSGTHYLVSLTLFLWLLLFDSMAIFFNHYFITQYIEYLMVSVNTILATELLFLLLLLFIKPTTSKNRTLPAFQSKLIEIVCNPGNTSTTIKNLLTEIFGFDISSEAIFTLIKRVIFSGIILSILYMILLSCIVIIHPGEEVVITIFGKVKKTGLHSGIHFKAPYPAGKALKYDVDLIRRVHVGSHRPQTPDGEVFKKDVPLLWTTIHGYNKEELLLISSPRQLVQNARESGGKIDITHNKTPSISLAGADIVVEYKIFDFIKYTSYNFNPERYLMVLSQSEVTRAVLKFDIDTLLSDERSELADLLKKSIQVKCDSAKLGIKVVGIGISAVHPPTDIADIFEENVAALQDRETKIQQAIQISLRTKIETAGSAEAFTTLVDQIEKEENQTGKKYLKTEQMILNCGGNVSKILSDAVGYRWSKEYIESGKSEKFKKELILYRTASNVYSYHRYLSILEDALSIKKKIVLSDTLKNLITNLNSKSDWILPNAISKQN